MSHRIQTYRPASPLVPHQSTASPMTSIVDCIDTVHETLTYLGKIANNDKIDADQRDALKSAQAAGDMYGDLLVELGDAFQKTVRPLVNDAHVVDYHGYKSEVAIANDNRWHPLNPQFTLTEENRRQAVAAVASNDGETTFGTGSDLVRDDDRVRFADRE